MLILCRGNTYLSSGFDTRKNDVEDNIKQVLGEENDVEVKSPVIRPCALCKKNIPRETPAFLSQGKYYHKDCFKCATCNKSCTSGNYLIRHDNKIVCKDCQETNETLRKQMFAPTETCFECKKPVGKGQKIGDKLYHRECLVCTTCRKPFEGGKVAIVNGNPVHDECRAKPQQVVRQNITGPLVQIERLAEMHQAGIITDEEFAQEKKKLLGL
jgi:hypothetical protein